MGMPKGSRFMIEVATSVEVPPPMPMMPCTAALPDQVVDDGRRAPDLVVGGGIAIGAVLLAHHFDRQAAAPRHLLGADVAGKGRRLLHAEVEQDRLHGPGRQSRCLTKTMSSPRVSRLQTMTMPFLLMFCLILP